MSVPEEVDVWLSVVVGLCDVLQQIPLMEIRSPPSLVMLPPPVAEFIPIPVIGVVIIVGIT